MRRRNGHRSAAVRTRQKPRSRLNRGSGRLTGRLRYDAAGRVEPRHLRVLVHGLEVDDPGLEDAHAVERLDDGLVHLEAREGPGREEMLAAQADGDALAHRARVGGDHVAVEERERDCRALSLRERLTFFRSISPQRSAAWRAV